MLGVQNKMDKFPKLKTDTSVLCIYVVLTFHSVYMHTTFVTPFLGAGILQNSRQGIGTSFKGINSSIYQKTQQLDAAKHYFFRDGLNDS